MLSKHKIVVIALVAAVSVYGWPVGAASLTDLGPAETSQDSGATADVPDLGQTEIGDEADTSNLETFDLPEATAPLDGDSENKTGSESKSHDSHDENVDGIFVTVCHTDDGGATFVKLVVDLETWVAEHKHHPGDIIIKTGDCPKDKDDKNGDDDDKDFRRVQNQVICEGDDGTLISTNPNDKAVRVRVTGPGGFDETRTVAAGGETRFMGLADGEYLVRTLTSDGSKQIGQQRMVVNCDEEEELVRAQLNLVCVEGDGELTATNPNDVAIQVRVTGPGGFDQTETIAAGGSATFSDLADGTYTVTSSTTNGNGEQIGQQTIQVACDEVGGAELVAVQVAADCPTTAGGRLIISNPNEEPVQVNITGPGGFDRTETIGARGQIQHTDLANGTFVVTTFVGEGEDRVTIGQETIVLNCEFIDVRGAVELFPLGGLALGAGGTSRTTPLEPLVLLAGLASLLLLRRARTQLN